MKLVAYMFQFYDEHPDRIANCDGRVWYEFNDGRTIYSDQLFARKGRAIINNRNVWAWDGNRDAPTLTPSYRVWVGEPHVLHLHVSGGKLDILPDSNIEHGDVIKLTWEEFFGDTEPLTPAAPG